MKLSFHAFGVCTVLLLTLPAVGDPATISQPNPGQNVPDTRKQTPKADTPAQTPGTSKGTGDGTPLPKDQSTNSATPTKPEIPVVNGADALSAQLNPPTANPDSFSDSYKGAIALYKQGHLAQAAKLVEASLVRSPQDAQMHGLLGYIYAKQGKSEDAVSELEAATHLNPNDIPSQNNLAQAYLGIHRNEDAARICRSVLQVKPNDSVANTNLGIALVQLQELSSAVAAFKAAALQSPTSTTLENLGAADIRVGDFDGAADAFGRAAELDPTKSNVWLNLGLSELRVAAKPQATKDASKKSIAALSKAIALDTDYKYDAHFGLGEANAETGERTLALKQFKIASEIRPLEFAPWFNMGVLYAQGNNLTEAISAYEHALTIKSDDVPALTGLGELLGPSDPAKATSLFESAAKIAPKNEGVHAMLGILYYKAGNANDAVSEFRNAVKLNSKDRTTRSNLASVLYIEKHYEEAAQQYDQLTALEPDDSSLQYQRGLAHEAAGNLDAAKSSFEAAVSIDPKNALAQNNLGVVYEKMGQQSLALNAYKKALLIDPTLAAAKTNVNRLKR